MYKFDEFKTSNFENLSKKIQNITLTCEKLNMHSTGSYFGEQKREESINFDKRKTV